MQNYITDIRGTKRDTQIRPSTAIKGEITLGVATTGQTHSVVEAAAAAEEERYWWCLRKVHRIRSNRNCL